MTRKTKLGTAFVVVTLIGCFAVYNHIRATPTVGERVLKVKPAELFIGDLKRIESLFDLSTGCVELEGPDGEFSLKVENQVWLNGEERKHGPWGFERAVQKPKLLTFSFKGFEEEKDHSALLVNVGLLAESGGTSNRARLKLPPIKKPEAKFLVSTSTSFAKLSEPLELKAGQPAMVFAFCVEDVVEGQQPRERKPSESIEDQVKLASRAVAFVVSWEEVKTGDK
jgi:hypothetical protein